MIFQKIPVFSMVLQAGPFARFILICLLVFSIVSWTIIIGKILANKRGKTKTRKGILSLQQKGGLLAWMQENQPSGNHAVERLIMSAYRVYENIAQSMREKSATGVPTVFVNTQFSVLQSTMENAVAREMEKEDWGQTFLAVAASVCPFIGLLGTVWGITHSFYEIGSLGSTSINIVAPGIAEALITTIFGLIVAIPCAVFYNLFTKRIRQQETQFIDFATALINDVKTSVLKELGSA